MAGGLGAKARVASSFLITDAILLQGCCWSGSGDTHNHDHDHDLSMDRLPRYSHTSFRFRLCSKHFLLSTCPLYCRFGWRTGTEVLSLRPFWGPHIQVFDSVLSLLLATMHQGWLGHSQNIFVCEMTLSSMRCQGHSSTLPPSAAWGILQVLGF